VGSGEHYGAVVNLDFDYRKYLDTVRRDGQNLVRIWSGAYREHPGSFGIPLNTLDPAPGRFLAPWARSDEPGYALGGRKFDLSRWDEAYFARLLDFVAEAGRRDIVVELTFFCTFFHLVDPENWAVSPMSARNNVNGIGDVPGSVALLDTLAKDGRVDRLYRDLAALLAAERLVDSAPTEEIDSRLATLLAPDSPWRPFASEIKGVAELRAGKTEAARATFSSLIDDPNAPGGIRIRARELLQGLGGPLPKPEAAPDAPPDNGASGQ